MNILGDFALPIPPVEPRCTLYVSSENRHVIVFEMPTMQTDSKINMSASADVKRWKGILLKSVFIFIVHDCPLPPFLLLTKSLVH